MSGNLPEYFYNRLARATIQRIGVEDEDVVATFMVGRYNSDGSLDATFAEYHTLSNILSRELHYLDVIAQAVAA